MKAFTVHGHFYQPPRENPWLQEVERQESAAPYHDWNERITRECYAKNVPNYPLMSFNFGPTLLGWMEKKAPEIYEKILEADRTSLETRDHGNAIAQCFNHIIMPLAKREDKELQVVWGARDFSLRFGRWPEGMWLPEMAVDLETLEILAQEGIRFVILAPHQIQEWQPGKDGRWKPYPGEFYPFPLYQELPGGKGIYIFPYHREMGSKVSFGQVLDSPRAFLEFILGYLDTLDQGLLHFATDGETFGHHKKRGASTLQATLHALERKGVTLSNFAVFLESVEWTPRVRIRENTSWSCAHGVERWRADCGCSTGGQPGWNQKWRTPLREAMDWLKDHLNRIFYREGEALFKDPREALMGYVDVMVQGPELLSPFLDAHLLPRASREDRIKAAKLLEMARMGQYMFTSCGWFFADISGLEAVQNMTFAARAIELAREVSGIYLEDGYLDRLYKAKSNISSEGNGLEIYKRRVVTRRFTTRDITAHYLITSALSCRFRETTLFQHRFTPSRAERLEKGPISLCCGLVEVTHLTFQEETPYLFSVLKYCPQDLHCVLKPWEGDEESLEKVLEGLQEAFHRGITQLVRELDRVFGPNFYGPEGLITVV